MVWLIIHRYSIDWDSAKTQRHSDRRCQCGAKHCGQDTVQFWRYRFFALCSVTAKDRIRKQQAKPERIENASTRVNRKKKSVGVLIQTSTSPWRNSPENYLCKYVNNMHVEILVDVSMLRGRQWLCFGAPVFPDRHYSRALVVTAAQVGQPTWRRAVR